MAVVPRKIYGPPPEQIDHRFWGKEPSEKNLNSEYFTVGVSNN